MEQLTSEHELGFDEINQAIDSIEIPSCPALVTQVMAEAQKDAPDLAVISRLISGDVGMAAFTLKLANSPFFRRGDGTKSVAEAVTRLGTRNVVCVVVAAALRTRLSDGLPEAFLEQFWNRAGQTASAAGLIARQLRGVSPDSAYTYGLFHDAAIPVMMRRFPDYPSTLTEAAKHKVMLPSLESQRYRCDHAVVGGLLARNWMLPTATVQAIRHHHEPGAYDLALDTVTDEVRTLVAIVHVAERLLSDVFDTEDNEIGILFDQACDYLGLNADDLNDLKDDLHEALA
jgi:HD-like signal output (HDOD) protein